MSSVVGVQKREACEDEAESMRLGELVPQESQLQCVRHSIIS